MARTITGGYKSYNFKEHDPILDQIDRLRELTGLNGKPAAATFVSAQSGVSVGTVNNWRDRKVRRPQFASVKAVVRGLGADVVIVYKGKLIRAR